MDSPVRAPHSVSPPIHSAPKIATRRLSTTWLARRVVTCLRPGKNSFFHHISIM